MKINTDKLAGDGYIDSMIAEDNRQAEALANNRCPRCMSELMDDVCPECVIDYSRAAGSENNIKADLYVILEKTKKRLRTLKSLEANDSELPSVLRARTKKRIKVLQTLETNTRALLNGLDEVRDTDPHTWYFLMYERG